MKRVLFALVLFAKAVLAAAAEPEPPNPSLPIPDQYGVVLGGNPATFVDLKTNETIPLTESTPQAPVKNIFAVPESGEALVWVTQDRKIWFKSPATSAVAHTLRLIDRKKMYERHRGSMDDREFEQEAEKNNIEMIAPLDIRRLMLIPDTFQICFETEVLGKSFYFTNPGDARRFGASGGMAAVPNANRGAWESLPYLEKKPDSRNSIFLLASKKFSDPTELGPEFGNFGVFPPISHFRSAEADERALRSGSMISINDWSDAKFYQVSLMALTSADTGRVTSMTWFTYPYNGNVERYSQKRDSCHFAHRQKWENGEMLQAFLYISRPKNRIGPIELRRVKKRRGVPTEPDKLPPIFELDVWLPQRVTWMSFKPNGDLTCLFEDGSLYTINGKELDERMSQCRLNRLPPPSKNSMTKTFVKENFVYSPNNTWRPNAVKEASGIPLGDCHHWVSDKTIIMRRDNAIVLQDIDDPLPPPQHVRYVEGPISYCLNPLLAAKVKDQREKQEAFELQKARLARAEAAEAKAKAKKGRRQ